MLSEKKGEKGEKKHIWGEKKGKEKRTGLDCASETRWNSRS